MLAEALRPLASEESWLLEHYSIPSDDLDRFCHNPDVSAMCTLPIDSSHVATMMFTPLILTRLRT